MKLSFFPFPFAVLIAILCVLPSRESYGGPLGLRLPTDNDAIFSNDPSKFYMYTNRTSPDGTRSKPWSAGRYGFVRNEKRTAIGTILTRFHEGIDIRPVKRDSSGNPLDSVNAITSGTVVYTNTSSSRSNYGNYVVVQHNWGEGNFYSLYAHLKSVSVSKGQKVNAGQKLGVMGYTGAGLNRERSHVHLELNMLMSPRFETWYGKHFTSKNHHGIYNGFNLNGLDVAGLFHSHKANPQISIADYIRMTPPYYKVTVPNNGTLDLVKRYPWLLTVPGAGSSWEIAFTQTGIPLEVKASNKSVTYPAVTWVKPSKIDHSYVTVSRVTGVGSSAKLTGSGSRFIQLITGAF